MAQVIEAVVSDGVFKPAESLPFMEFQRVRLIVEPVDEPAVDRATALKRLLAGIESMHFFSNGKRPQRRVA